MCDVKEKRIPSIANSLGYNPNDEVKTYRSFCDKNMLNSNVGSWKIHTFCIKDRHTHTHLRLFYNKDKKNPPRK